MEEKTERQEENKVLEVTLNFNNVVATITSNEEGMFDLNDVWRTWDLRASKRPSQWRSSTAHCFIENANLQTREIETIKGGSLRSQSMFGTQLALYAYAMWVDVEFYVAVVECFTAVANEDFEEAAKIARAVTSTREAWREGHGRTVRAFAKAEGLKHMSSEHKQSNMFRLVCKAVFGRTPKQFKEDTGLSPRDWIEENCDLEKAREYSRALDKAEAYLEVGLTYNEVKEKVDPPPLVLEEG